MNRIKRILSVLRVKTVQVITKSLCKFNERMEEKTERKRLKILFVPIYKRKFTRNLSRGVNR